MAAEAYMPLKAWASSRGLSYSFANAACKRDDRSHRLPHINAGASKRPHRLVRASVADAWLEEEEAMAR